jgi:hypothetical protein
MEKRQIGKTKERHTAHGTRRKARESECLKLKKGFTAHGFLSFSILHFSAHRAP